MASSGGGNREPNSDNQPIPLRDLSRPPGAAATHHTGDGLQRSDDAQGHIRRSLLSGRSFPRRYERLAEDSPGQAPADSSDGFQTISLSQDANSSGGGLPRTPERGPNLHIPYVPREQSPHVHSRLDNIGGHNYGYSESDNLASLSQMEAEYFNENVSSPVDASESDRTPLTDRRYLQPISGATEPPTNRKKSFSSHSGQSVRFADAPSGRHLGDDLPHLEGGLGRRNSSFDSPPRSSRPSSHRSRRLSPASSSSALSRAGSMMRIMSQRVVNLSNEPELVEQSLRRKSSLKTARLEGPPSLPAMTDYAHDRTDGSWKTQENTPEKRPSVHHESSPVPINPLKGKALGIFSSGNKLRKILCEILIHPATEPTILILIIIQTVLLAVESSFQADNKTGKWGDTAFDYAFLVIFVIYTFELAARIIVSGLIINPQEYSTLDRSNGLRNALVIKGRELFMPHRHLSTKKTNPLDSQMSVLRSFTSIQPQTDDGDEAARQRARLARRAFLRHSFNRLDFLAVISYWISFVLSLMAVESSRHIFLFRMLSSLRILRLLALTNGTTVILRSLKKAAPLLVNVAFFIGFFWLLFAIIGVQSFKSSLQRSCVWVDPENVRNFTMNNAPDGIQFCGGHLDNTTGVAKPWVLSNGVPGATKPKGYLCPQGSLCVEGTNPYGGTISFDNVAHSLELVFVVMSSNTFTDLLYYTTDSDYLVASVFFIASFVVLSLWLVNLLIAVITSSFQVIREESKRSAFTADNIDVIPPEEETPKRVSTLKRVYSKTYWLWISLIVLDLIVQGMRSSSTGSGVRYLINSIELAVTVILVFEILFRFAADWRNFFKNIQNWFDLMLAVATAIIQLPFIHNSDNTYAALSIFQILRIYRVILAFSLTRSLIMTVFGNVVGLLNLILFVFLITFLTAIFAVRLFRDVIPRKTDDGEIVRVSFFNIYNSFLGMYQILSSENWTSILYNSTASSAPWKTAWISASFFIMWFILANFVVLNMFIAVIQESFDVSEDEKRLHQVKAFLQQKQLNASSSGNPALSSIFRFGRNEQRYRDPLDHGPAALEMLLKDAVVHEFLDEPVPLRQTESQAPDLSSEPAQPGRFATFFSKLKSRIMNREPNPFYSKLKISRDYDELDPTAMAKEVLSASEQRKQAQRKYLQRYPRYNVSLFLFQPTNSIRRLCQRMVGPGRGNTRIEGVDPYKPVWYTFSAFIYAAIVAMVLIACIATPLYQRAYFQRNHFAVTSWFVWTDIGFAILFSVETLIKVIADGFFWTPNAYFRGSWGFIDGVVLVTLWINVIASLSRNGDVSRVVGAFRALRALRLLNVSDSARETFHSVIIIGGWKVISAAFVSMGFLVPFAIYGLNLFNGKMKKCNDDDFGYDSLSHCVGEYTASPFAWKVLAPRSVDNPFYSFDTFGDSLFILFQIVSQEGWTDVLWSAMSITGVGRQPKPLTSQANGLFFVVFNLLGAVFVLTLFVSVFMRNYTEQTGVAFLTAEQRSWLELRKLLRQISPSKRSVDKKSSKFKAWSYRIAVKKHGAWARTITTLLLIHLFLLVLEFYPSKLWWDKTRDALFFVLTLFYIANIVIRLVGLTWPRFRRSSWDLYSVAAVSGTFVTTLLSIIGHENRAFMQLHKLFLVSITLMIIPRNNQLDQLFKTAAASLTSIFNLLTTWFVLFLVYAIALTQIFGLTKFGEGENNNINFRTVPKALILLFRMSCGEGWNQLMEDFATMEYPYCTAATEFFNSDCGSKAWARTLFISWNILSMYIFVSLFVSLIFESFSYVYQRSSGLYAISREEIRRYKEAWATFDPDGSGYISKEQFPRLLGELSGVFEMRVYDGDFTVGHILEQCNFNRRHSQQPRAKSTDCIDLKTLNRVLQGLPVTEIRRRRARLNAFYEEVLVSADPERGISFTSCLMILAHYNVINDSKSLRRVYFLWIALEEFLRRRARLQRVDEAVRRSIVVGFFNTLYWSRRFRRHQEFKHNSRLVEVPQFSVPEIYVEDDGPEDAVSEGTQSRAPSPSMLSPTSDRSGTSERSSRGLRVDTTQSAEDPFFSPTHSEWSQIGSLSPHRTTLGDGDPGHTDVAGGRSRANSSVSVQGVMDSFDNSVWGESIRRSFTRRRSQGE
ncbi:calcium channel protein [Ophidiomyces ophidiicola]|nr:calcium channel protein [Ophidiomyces ophidiicola]KAI1922380.1 calcium channel protein [Ophidiomyces ophidiicola]KAI2033266.1 calcium channel protein [Ophidiomyces ophidiicola]KAI2094677.1 calcium channel protein [Ophidiomyces ophidiicola]KAI2126838.1 calcium channel protein [Ophidiomyces ophidiicola]